MLASNAFHKAAMVRVLLIVMVFSLISVSSASADSMSRNTALGERLVSFYGKKHNYRSVKREVLKWHGTTRNGCVAFVSTALRRIGYGVPQDDLRDGYGISRITFSFSDYLEEQGWKRIKSPRGIQPGDLVFTTGFPDHVFVFHSWRNKRRLIARVIDNQGFLTRRHMRPPSSSKHAAFAYALRAPAPVKAIP
jgi:hypothetical protein